MLDIESHKIAYSSTLAFNLMVQLEVALASQSEVGRAQAASVSSKAMVFDRYMS